MDKFYRAFSAGEVSPQLQGRVDYQRQQVALKTLRNGYVKLHGGVTNRAGTRFSGFSLSGSNGDVYWGDGRSCRHHRYKYTAQQQYMLELGHNHIRILKDGGYLLNSAQAITGVTLANPAVFTYSGADNFVDGYPVYISDLVGLVPTSPNLSLNNRSFLVTNVDTGANTFQLEDQFGNVVDLSSGYTGFTSANVAPHIVIDTLYDEDDIYDLRIKQDGKVMTIVHPNYPVMELQRANIETNWTFTEVVFAPTVQGTTKDVGGNTGVFTIQDFDIAITGVAVAPSATDRPRISINPRLANLQEGDRIYIDGVGGTVELNGKWWLVHSRNYPTGASTVADIYLVDTNGNPVDTTTWGAYTSGGNIYTREEQVYRVTVVDKDGQESLASEEATLFFSNNPQLTAPISIKWSPPMVDGLNLGTAASPGTNGIPRDDIASFNLYRKKNGIFGYIGSRDVEVADDEAFDITNITNATPSVVTCPGHDFVKGEKVYIYDALAAGPQSHPWNGFTFLVWDVAGNDVTLYNLNVNPSAIPGIAYSPGGGGRIRRSDYWFHDDDIEPALSDVAPPKKANQPFETPLDSVTISAMSGAATPVQITTDAAHGLVDGDIIKFRDIVGTIATELNFDTNGGVYFVAVSSPYTVASNQFDIYPHPFHTGDSGYTASSTGYTSGGKITRMDWPGAVEFHEQRRIFARTNRNANKVFATQIGNAYNFNESVPSKPDDALFFSIPAQEAQEIRHLLHKGALFIFTDAAEWISDSGDAGYTVDNILNKIQSDNGIANTPAPLSILNTILYVSERGSQVWDVAYRFETQSYRGEDRSLFSEHLFDMKRVVSWGFQLTPDSVLWMSLDDGSLLSMTYYPEHEVFGWGHHDGGGYPFYMSVETIKEGNEHFVYLAAKRTLANGGTYIYTERMASRSISDVKDAFFVDCGKSYDEPYDVVGLTIASPMVLTVRSATALGYPDILVDDLLDVDESMVRPTDLSDDRYRVAYASSASTTPDGIPHRQHTLRLVGQYPVSASERNITGITNANPAVVTTATDHGLSNGDVVCLRNCLGMTEVNDLYFIVAGATANTFELNTMLGAPVNSGAYGVYSGGGEMAEYTLVDSSTWESWIRGGKVRIAKNVFSGLEHLEGEVVSVLADGNVSAITETDGKVTGGKVTLNGDVYASRVHVGLPYISDFETLDVNDAGATASGKQLSATRATVRLTFTRGGKYGPDETKLRPHKQREYEDYGQETLPREGEYDITTDPSWKSKGRIFIRQDDPLPMTLLSVKTKFTASDVP